MKVECLHIVTPLLESHVLSNACDRKVLLKMDNIQPSGSYKIRGIGNLVTEFAKEGIKEIVSSSGGNAGMSAAYAARKLNLKATIIIPETTDSMMIERLQSENANVIVHGSVWNEAEEKAQTFASENKDCKAVHPFNHSYIWKGVSSIVDEILLQSSEKPSAIVLCVGGGGLLCGVMEGLIKHNATDITIVTMETIGADCFNVALEAGRPVSIGKITSIAKTLGALTVVPRVFDLLPHVKIISKVLSDRDAVDACIKFCNDHRHLVEPSCGVSLAAGYCGIIKYLLPQFSGTGPVVFIVCGGNAVTLEMLEKWKEEFKL